MSDESMGGEGGDAPQMEDKKFFVDRAKSGRATCRKCKQKLEAGGLRIAKAGHNPFGPGLMKLWHHVPCMFEVFAKQRASTARINSPDDVAGWSDLDEDDRNHILSFLPEGAAAAAASASSQKGKAAPAPAAVPSAPASSAGSKPSAEDRAHKDNSFREFRRLCAEVANLPAYGDKTAAVRKMFTSGTSGESFKGDLLLWVRLLLPGAVKRVYNIQSKQIVKLFSRILHADQDEMLEDLEQGDVAETVRIFFERSTHLQPTKKSTLSLYDVDEFLEKLSTMTKEDEQAHHFKQIAKRCTSNDLKMIIRLVKHDLRINAGPKHILDAVHADAYQAFQMSRDISSVIARATGKNFLQGKGESGKKQGTAPGGMSIGVALMTPVLPMLAEACKSVEQAMKKCPNGMFSEIKYDGERVQVHKRGDDFKYFSRSLKPVMPHKVSHFKDYIPEAFPHGKDVILDSEILMIDTQTGKPLPFGTLGRQKKEGLKSANVCLFVFDCIYYNGEILLSKPIKERRKILHSVMTQIPNRIMFSEAEEVHQPKQLEVMIEKVFKLGLEGLVLKDLMSTYEPGKRHWLKVKKDYLFGGAMADAADLVVLGAWFGTGQKGGMMSVFLMGCYDTYRDKWCTVTKVHTGHDDKTLERLQDELGPQVTKISREASRVPSWLNCTKTMIPDFVAKDPKSMPVWEITGAEFTRHDVHTADGISIRFPRVTRIRSDKDWKTATSLAELKELYKKSKDNADFSLIQSSPKSSPDVSKRQRLTRSRSPTPVKDTRKESKKTSNKQEEIVDQEMKEEVSEENNSARKRSLSPNKRGENSGSGHKRKFGSNQSSPSEEEPRDSSTPKKENKAHGSEKFNKYDTDTTMPEIMLWKSSSLQPPHDLWAFATFLSWELNGIDDRVLLAQAKRSIVDTVTRFRVEQEILCKAQTSRNHETEESNIKEDEKLVEDTVSAEMETKMEIHSPQTPEDKETKSNEESEERKDKMDDVQSDNEEEEEEEDEEKKEEEEEEAEEEKKKKADWEKDSDWESCCDEDKKGLADQRCTSNNVELADPNSDESLQKDEKSVCSE